jgi:spermidine synthase
MVLKWALAGADRPGFTIGRIYAFESLGAITGVFLTGFVLVPHVGSAAVICTVALVLAAMALFMRPGPATMAWLTVPVFLLILAIGPWQWSQSWGETIAIRDRVAQQGEEGLIYVKETEYQRVAVWALANNRRAVYLDDLLHSYVSVDDPEWLAYAYIHIFATFTRAREEAGGGVDSLFLGGGGYTLPRWIAHRYPDARSAVVEIDPGVTRAAHVAGGMASRPGFDIIHRDARQAVRDMLALPDERRPRFDLVFGDVFGNNKSLPHHLTTVEFMRELHGVMADDGMMLINIIDNPRRGRFLAAMTATLRQVFGEVRVVATPGHDDEDVTHTTYVLVASNAPLPIAQAVRMANADRRPFFVLAESQMDVREQAVGARPLTDNHAPVEHLISHWLHR